MPLNPAIEYYVNGEQVDQNILNRPLEDIVENLNNIYLIIDGIPTYTAADADKFVMVNSTGTGLVYEDFAFDFVRAPEPTSPSDEATSVSLSPMLTASVYSPLYSVDARDYREFQLDLDTGDFSTPVLSAQLNADSWSPDLSAYTDTSFIWRCRDVSLNGYTSDWSVVYTFTTGAAYVITPSASVSQDGSKADRAPLITGSAFDVFGATDTHQNTDWEVVRTSDSVVVWSSLNDGVNLESIQVPEQTLDINTEYSFRVRYTGTTYGASEWGSVTRTTVNYFEKTPVLSGDSSGFELDDHTTTIDNYDASLTYVVNVSAGSYSRTGATITWTLPEVSQDTTHQVSVYAVNAYAEQSSTATKNVLVVDIPIVADNAFIITNFGSSQYNDLWSV